MNASSLLLFRRVALTASSATVQRRFAADLAKAKHREIANVRLKRALVSSKLARSDRARPALRTLPRSVWCCS
jgi:hypothetical protein